jgi:hypothetical protein
MVATIKFGGEDYEYVDLSTITLDEAMLLHEYSGLTVDKLEDAGFHPGLVAALIHITVARGNPQIRKQDLRAKIGKLPMSELEQVFEDVAVDDEADDARPPASPGPSGEPPEPDEQPKTDEPPASSGFNGEPTSESQASVLRAIGSPG